MDNIKKLYLVLRHFKVDVNEIIILMDKILGGYGYEIQFLEGTEYQGEWDDPEEGENETSSSSGKIFENEFIVITDEVYYCPHGSDKNINVFVKKEFEWHDAGYYTSKWLLESC